MRERGDVVAYVRSRRAAVESHRVLVPVPVPIGMRVAVVPHARRVVRYARVLDPARPSHAGPPFDSQRMRT